MHAPHVRHINAASSALCSAAGLVPAISGLLLGVTTSSWPLGWRLPGVLRSRPGNLLGLLGLAPDCWPGASLERLRLLGKERTSQPQSASMRARCVNSGVPWPGQEVMHAAQRMLYTVGT